MQWPKQFVDGQHYEDAQHEWGKVLVNLSGEDIDRGLNAWDSEYPPNVYEFRNACKPPESQKALHKPYCALPKPKGDPAIANKAVKNLAGILKRKSAVMTDTKRIPDPVESADLAAARASLTREAEAAAKARLLNPRGREAE